MLKSRTESHHTYHGKRLVCLTAYKKNNKLNDWRTNANACIQNNCKENKVNEMEGKEIGKPMRGGEIAERKLKILLDELLKRRIFYKIF